MFIVCDVRSNENVYISASGTGCWCFPAGTMLFCLNFPYVSVVKLLSMSRSFTGKGESGGSMHVTLCDYIMPWDSLSTTQKKSLSQRYQMGCDCKVSKCRAICLFGLSPGVEKRERRHLFRSWSTKPDITDQTRQGMSQDNKYKNKQPCFIYLFNSETLGSPRPIQKTPKKTHFYTSFFFTSEFKSRFCYLWTKLDLLFPPRFLVVAS